MISEADLNFWIKNQYNVIFRGRHGCGKTTLILNAFTAAGLRYQYFSASTMDPWVDFIGVPKEKIDEKGNSYLDLVRPKHFQEDAVEAIFLDEFNRSSKKVRNAVMELIQFKSINGKKFNNLKVIWAAINPEDDEENKYDVEALDPAQLDRFHVCVDVPYTPHVSYFRNKYGKDTADVAVTWWKELSKESQNIVSPRRLDYAIDMHSKGGNIKYVLPNSVNTNKLIVELATGSISKKLKNLFDEKKTDEAKQFLAVENNFAVAHTYILKSKEYKFFFLPLLPDEKIIGLMTKNKEIENYVFQNYTKFDDVIKNLAAANSSKLGITAKKIVKQNSVSSSKSSVPLMNIASGMPIGGGIINKSFCVTGILSDAREVIHENIKKRGGKVHESLKSYTDYLIVGADPGASKLREANKFKTKQITESQFDSMSLSPNVSSNVIIIPMTIEAFENARSTLKILGASTLDRKKMYETYKEIIDNHKFSNIPIHQDILKRITIDLGNIACSTNRNNTISFDLIEMLNYCCSKCAYTFPKDVVKDLKRKHANFNGQ